MIDWYTIGLVAFGGVLGLVLGPVIIIILAERNVLHRDARH